MRAPAAPPFVPDAEAQEGLASVAQVRSAGLSDRRLSTLVAHRVWAHPARGVYDTTPFAVRQLSALRRRAAWLALLAYGPEAIAVGSCALALQGIEGLPMSIRPEAALPDADRREPRPPLRLRRFDDGMETVVVAGRRVASPAWALAQAVPELPRANGLAVLDSALYRKVLDRAGLERAHDLARGRRGVARTHDLWALADGKAQSPLESFGRLECVDDGVAPDVLQLRFLDPDGRERARGDMGWRRRGGGWLLVEMDGREVHDTPDAVFADRYRQNMIAMAGDVSLLRFTGRDLGHVASTVRRALGR